MTVPPDRKEGDVTFRDRHAAGRQLGEYLAYLRDERPVVLALPRGGVPVAAEVAAALGAPLDVIVVRKLGLPFQPELGFGAIGEGGVRLLDTDLIRRAGLSEQDVATVEHQERIELARRVRRYRGDRPPTPIGGRTVVIVDDGLATGGTAGAAVQVARAQGARRIVVAVPVAPPETVAQLRREADEVVSLVTPSRFVAVGLWYDDFGQTPDSEVATLLQGRDPAADGRPIRTREVVVPVDQVELAGSLTLPPRPVGLVLFAHGSGSGRHSPRNVMVAESLHAVGLGTLLFDLLTPDESQDRSNVFNIALLGHRLLTASTWLGRHEGCADLPLGYFGASTGGGAALWAAGAPGSTVGAVVSRGGRPDLAGDRLSTVHCPTLLIVGGADREVLMLNRTAATRLGCRHHLAVVPGAGHLFEEPGALEGVAQLAGRWFLEYLPSPEEPPRACP